MPHRSPDSAATPSWPEELLRFYREPGGQILLVRCARGPAALTLGTVLLGQLPGPGVVVATPERARVYREGLTRPGTPERHGWTVLEATPGLADEIRAMARALAAAPRLLADPQRDGVLSALWLPPAILEAMGRLPDDGAGVLVVDSWDALVAGYTPDGAIAPDGMPTRSELESFLAGSLRRFGRTHVVLITDGSPTALLPLVDGIVDVDVALDGPRVRASFRVTRARGWTVDERQLALSLETGEVTWTPPV
jgi:hypothetical protein